MFGFLSNLPGGETVTPFQRSSKPDDEESGDSSSRLSCPFSLHTTDSNLSRSDASLHTSDDKGQPQATSLQSPSHSRKSLKIRRIASKDNMGQFAHGLDLYPAHLSSSPLFKLLSHGNKKPGIDKLEEDPGRATESSVSQNGSMNRRREERSGEGSRSESLPNEVHCKNLSNLGATSQSKDHFMSNGERGTESENSHSNSFRRIAPTRVPRPPNETHERERPKSHEYERGEYFYRRFTQYYNRPESPPRDERRHKRRERPPETRESRHYDYRDRRRRYVEPYARERPNFARQSQTSQTNSFVTTRDHPRRSSSSQDRERRPDKYRKTSQHNDKPAEQNDAIAKDQSPALPTLPASSLPPRKKPRCESTAKTCSIEAAEMQEASVVAQAPTEASQNGAIVQENASKCPSESTSCRNEPHESEVQSHPPRPIIRYSLRRRKFVSTLEKEKPESVPTQSYASNGDVTSCSNPNLQEDVEKQGECSTSASQSFTMTSTSGKALDCTTGIEAKILEQNVASQRMMTELSAANLDVVLQNTASEAIENEPNAGPDLQEMTNMDPKVVQQNMASEMIGMEPVAGLQQTLDMNTNNDVQQNVDCEAVAENDHVLSLTVEGQTCSGSPAVLRISESDNGVNLNASQTMQTILKDKTLTSILSPPKLPWDYYLRNPKAKPPVEKTLTHLSMPSTLESPLAEPTFGKPSITTPLVSSPAKSPACPLSTLTTLNKVDASLRTPPRFSSPSSSPPVRPLMSSTPSCSSTMQPVAVPQRYQYFMPGQWVETDEPLPADAKLEHRLNIDSARLWASPSQLLVASNGSNTPQRTSMNSSGASQTSRLYMSALLRDSYVSE